MKKQWISVKCGLSRDPKHRRQMGKTVWTFLHMLDLADWETGIVYDWKDENAAEDMGIDIRVLREDRRQLEKEDYISCKQKQYGQDITIHNWTNPREYTGEVYNKKQGYKKLPPSKDAQGDTQGDAQGSIKDVTPTLDSKNKDQNVYYPFDMQEVIKEANIAMDKHLSVELSQAPGIKREARINDILNYLGVTFRRNTSTREWLGFAKYIDSEFQSKGWDVKQFVSWLFGQKDYNPNYWPVKKMMEFYPSAFAATETKHSMFETLS